MDAFATVADYMTRYGEGVCDAQLSAMLDDATAFISAQPGFALLPESDPGHGVQAANLVRVTCAVVHRSLMAGDLAGASSYSQGAVGYTASVTLANPSGDYYLTKAERAALGISGGRVGTSWPYATERPVDA